MEVKINIDTVKYTEKPNTGSGEFGAIRNRLCQKDRVRRITPEGLMKAVEMGLTFTPAKMHGTGKDSWKSQQVICADIDNDSGIKADDGSHIMIPHPMFPDDALEVMKANEITPYFMYYSFSNTDAWPKFRVVLILDEPLTDADQRTELIKRFNYMFNQAVEHSVDKTSEDCARIYLGGRPGCVFYQSGEVTPIHSLQELPEIPQKAPESPVKAREPYQASNTPRRAEGAPYRSYSELQAMFEHDKETFDLAEYVSATTNSKRFRIGSKIFFNPCPICGHNNDFNVSGAVFKCLSVSNGAGGTIIDYLMNKQKEERTLDEALDYFKYEIMGYDREEWKEAWLDEKYPERVAKRKAAEEAQRASQANSGQASGQKEGEVAPMAQNAPQAPQAPQRPKLIRTNISKYVENGGYDADITYFDKYRDRKMGIHKDIDRYLTLYPGLAVLGGASSLGKTTFAVNVIDNLIDKGEHVLYFSLEQLPIELTTKFLAKGMSEHYPLLGTTNTEIKNGAKGPEQEEERRKLVQRAKHLEVITANFHTTAQDITECVKEYIKENSCKPVVVIDYLQLIAPPEGFRGGIREYTDENIKAIKDMQKNNGLFVIMISSLNRSNNYEPVSYESFKETSLIEFTCDYVWALQLAIQDPDNTEFYYKIGPKGGLSIRQPHEKKGAINIAQAQIPKKVEFISLKNRNGKQVFKAYFNYYPQYDCYSPISGDGLKFEYPEGEELEELENSKTPFDEDEEELPEADY